MFFLNPAFSRLLLGLLGDGQRKLACLKWFTPCDPLSHLLLAPTVLGEGIDLRLLDVTQETDEVLEIAGGRCTGARGARESRGGTSGAR